MTIIPPYEPKAGWYSPHFAKREMYASEMAARKGIDNTPPPFVEANLSVLCSGFLENIRARFGPIRVTSGFRCTELNAAIGGSTTSAHMDGRAADLQPLEAGVTLRQVVDWLIASPMEWDQVIHEANAWVHIGIAGPGQKPRRQALMYFVGDGYFPYDPGDSRRKS